VNALPFLVSQEQEKPHYSNALLEKSFQAQEISLLVDLMYQLLLVSNKLEN